MSYFNPPVPYYYQTTGSANQDSTVVKVGETLLMTLVIINVISALRYLKIYDTATAPTSLSIPVLNIPIPDASGAGGGVAVPLPVAGIHFTNGLAFRVTTGFPATNTGSCSANDVGINMAIQ